MNYTDGTMRYEVERKSNVTLPDDNDLIETIFCEGNNLLVIRKKPPERYSDDLTRCSDANALVSALTRTTDNDDVKNASINESNTVLADDDPHYPRTLASDKPKAAKSDPHYSVSVASDEPKAAKPKSTDPHYSGSEKSAKGEHTLSEDDNAIDLTNPNITAVEGELVDTKTGEIIGKCKRADSLTRAWDNQRWKLYNVPWEQSCFISATVDNNPTYARLNKLSTDYSLWLKDNYPDVGGCLFLEPREDGSWHSHFIPYFPNGVPDDFESKTKAWWGQFNTKDCDNQVEVKLFDDEEHLKNTVDYLKPTAKERKRKNVKYYPLGSQPIRCFGRKLVEPKKALTTFAVAKEITTAEKVQWRKQVKVFNTLTDTLLYDVSDYWFDAKLNLQPPKAETVNNTNETTASDHREDVFTDDGKTDWFTCKHNGNKCKCDKCDRQETCDKRNRCEEHCIGFDTSFCRGCVWNE